MSSSEFSSMPIEKPQLMAIDFQERFLSTGESFKQPQLLTLIFITILIAIISIVVFFKVRKVKPNEAPNTIALFAEQYVTVVDNMVSESGENKMNKTAPYFLGLLTFLIFGNLASLIGLEPVSTSYSIPLTLALITWLGIYVVGFIHSRFKWFMKFVKNPLEIVGVQSIIISLSFRIFGNIMGGTVLLLLLNFFTGWVWGMIPIPWIGQINLLGSIVTVPFRFYFDIFGTLIQCFIFVLLSTIFWGTEISEEKPQKSKNKKSFFNFKRLKKVS